jgi:UDP-2,3-diacylglucosamine pyrophosphatase LpxH
MHQPDWGWLEHGNKEWIALANQAKIDLVIAGHDHAYSYQAPNAQHTYYPYHAYHVSVLGQDQLMRVSATRAELAVSVIGLDEKVITRLRIPVHP